MGGKRQMGCGGWVRLIYGGGGILVNRRWKRARDGRGFATQRARGRNGEKRPAAYRGRVSLSWRLYYNTADMFDFSPNVYSVQAF